MVMLFTNLFLIILSFLLNMAKKNYWLILNSFLEKKGWLIIQKILMTL